MSERDKVIQNYMTAEKAVEEYPDRKLIKELQIAKLALEDVEARYYEGPKPEEKT